MIEILLTEILFSSRGRTMLDQNCVSDHGDKVRVKNAKHIIMKSVKKQISLNYTMCLVAVQHYP